MEYRSARTIPAIIILMLALCQGIAAQQGIEVSVRFYDKRIYYTDTPIQVLVEVYNNSAQTFRFKAAENRVFNVDFRVKTLANRELSKADYFIMERNADQPVYYRELSLEPGERFSFMEDVRSYVKIAESGVFTVEALFYPELYRGNSPPSIVSNALSLSVKPGLGLPDVKAMVEAITGELVQRNPIPPDEVVDFTLSARQKNQWGMFFLYLDLEGLLKTNPTRLEKYSRLGESERLAMIADYKLELQEETTDQDILLIPYTYEIAKTTYTPDMATVKVMEYFQYPDFTEIKEYTYYLARQDRIWLIYDYDVRNAGTK